MPQAGPGPEVELLPDAALPDELAAPTSETLAAPASEAPGGADLDRSRGANLGPSRGANLGPSPRHPGWRRDHPGAGRFPA